MADDKPKKRRKLMSVRLPPGMTASELVAARRDERTMTRAIESGLNDAEQSGEWVGEHESGLDKDGVFDP